MVRALTSQGCGLGSDDTCRLSSLLVLVHAPSGLSLGSLVFLPQQKPTFQILIQPGNSGHEEPPQGLFTVK